MWGSFVTSCASQLIREHILRARNYEKFPPVRRSTSPNMFTLVHKYIGVIPKIMRQMWYKMAQNHIFLIHSRINSLHTIFLSCLLIFGMTHRQNTGSLKVIIWHLSLWQVAGEFTCPPQFLLVPDKRIICFFEPCTLRGNSFNPGYSLMGEATRQMYTNSACLVPG